MCVCVCVCALTVSEAAARDIERSDADSDENQDLEEPKPAAKRECHKFVFPTTTDSSISTIKFPLMDTVSVQGLYTKV